MSVRILFVFALSAAFGCFNNRCPAQLDWNFNRIASFPISKNNGQRSNEPSAAEIVAASGDGMTLIYTDGLLKAVGRIDIRDPRQPQPLGLIDVGGEPTSITVINNFAYVSVNTSASFTQPSGKLLVIDLSTGKIESSCELGGQPDSTARNPAGTFIVVAIENERDGAAGDGRVPQLPAGWVAKIPLKDGIPLSDQIQKIEVSGLAEVAPEDPEPEFVDVNSQDEIVVTLQENNHLVIIDKNGRVARHFSAGKVDLKLVDTVDDGALNFINVQPSRSREPDSVQWIDDSHFITCNEGDMDGGARSITVFSKDGRVVFESNSEFETPIINAGHYSDKRSAGKGVEPEGLEVGTFGNRKFAFALAERSSTMSVFEVLTGGQLKFRQLLPTGIGPEGAIAIPQRNLIVVSSEVDLVQKGGTRAHVMIYEYQPAKPAYPEITSTEPDRRSGWGAISGMVAGADGILYFVNSGIYKSQPTIFTVGTKRTPPRVVGSMLVKRNGKPALDLDMQGVTLDGQGGYWIASIGRSEQAVANANPSTAPSTAPSTTPSTTPTSQTTAVSNSIPHAIYHVSSAGDILAEIALPTELLEHQSLGGAEGITKVGDQIWIAMHREWKDDPEGQVKLLAYDIKTGKWGAVRYPLEKPQSGWCGLSEMVAHGDFFYVIERDNQVGEAAVTKKIFRIAAAQMKPQPLRGSVGPLPLVTKEEVRDLHPDLKATAGYCHEKISGLAIFPDGAAWLSTDNNGSNETNGETRFWTIGKVK